MNWQILSSQVEKKGIQLDPRTKLFLLLTISILVVGGEVSGVMVAIKPMIAVIPFLLLLTIGKWRQSICFISLFITLYLFELLILPVMGKSGFLLLFFCGLFGRLLPGVVMGYYTVSTTTVSEFIAAMERMHLTQKLIIPLAVLFRFFPTVMEEYHNIGDAMRMRGVCIGGRKTSKMLEYRFIPMMVCSVKIGEELSAASLTRGLGAPIKRTNICQIGFHKFDVFMILYSALMLVLDLFQAIDLF